MKTEKITHEKGNPEAWICICKNTPCDSGFYPCNAAGEEIEPDAAWDGKSYVCAGCGRIIDQNTLKVIGVKTKKEKIMLKNKTAAAPKKVAKNSTAMKIEDARGASRAVLMQKVREMGIKNFRVMNKEELGLIVFGAPKAQIEAIQLAAVKRWKAGWSKNKAVANVK